MAGTAPAIEALAGAAPFAPDAHADDAAVFAAARAQFLIPAGVAYCNTGTLGASPREVVEALTAGIRRIETDLAAWPYEQPDGEPLTGYQQLLEVRQAAGRFVNASAAEIALTQNATMGMNFLANGLDLAAGDEVVSTDQEHGGGISPWRLLAKRRGVVVKELPLEPALAGGPDAIMRLFESALTPRTKVVMFSHITSGLGARLPARELCALVRDRGALAIVDGAQAVGTRVRRLRRQPAQVDDGAERHRLPVRPTRCPGSILDDARELSVGQPPGWRIPVHAIRHRKRSRG
jgi:selenocysteine lyase/cysteine desulfurase